MADLSRITRLILDQRSGKLSEKEQRELEAWTRESPQHQGSIDGELRPEDYEFYLEMLIGTRKEAAKERLLQRLQQLEHPATVGPDIEPDTQTAAALPTTPARTRRIVLWATATAAILACLTFGAIRLSHKTTQQPLAMRYPGSPILIDGKDSLATDRMEIGETARLRQATVTKEDIDQITFEWAHPGEDHPASLSIYIPPGSDRPSLQITLPDGSKSILVSGLLTALQPTINDSNQRKTLLAGVAYFLVLKDPDHPFSVQSLHSRSLDLGTSFLISSAEDRSTDSITLIEGSLKVSNDKSTQTLKKGQTALVDDQSVNIVVCDPDDRVMRFPWRNAFDFTNQNLEVAMERIRRRYHIKKIDFGPDVDTTTPGLLSEGFLDKNLGLSSTIKVLNKIKKNELKFFLSEDSTLHVMRW